MPVALKLARCLAVAVARVVGVGVGVMAAVALGVGACGGGDGASGPAVEGGEMSSGGDESGVNDPHLQVPSESCAAAPMVGQGRFAGSLRDRGPDPELGGVCGGGGPDVFLRVSVPVRADLRIEARGGGFTPRVSLAPPGCQRAPMLACAGDGVAELVDVAEGTVVTLAIGADPEQFAALSGVAVAAGEPDPLGFTVDVGMRRVLAAGEVCVPTVRGRCGAGTLCLPEISAADTDTDTDAETGDSAWTCTPLAGDGCLDPEEVTLQLVDGVGGVSVDPEQPQSDVHRHSCTGAGTRERVLRLALPAELGPQDSLELRVDHPEVGLALRAPGCLAGDELACMAPRPSGAQVVIAAPDELRRAGVAPYLFVELPEPGVLAEPVLVQLRKVGRAPPVSAGN